MALMVCTIKKEKVKTRFIGDILDELTIASAVCKDVAERVSEEKGLGQQEAIKFVIECIEKSQSTFKE